MASVHKRLSCAAGRVGDSSASQSAGAGMGGIHFVGRDHQQSGVWGAASRDTEKFTIERFLMLYSVA